MLISNFESLSKFYKNEWRSRDPDATFLNTFLNVSERWFIKVGIKFNNLGRSIQINIEQANTNLFNSVQIFLELLLTAIYLVEENFA